MYYHSYIFAGILGYNMKLDLNVQSQGKYSIYLLDDCTAKLKKEWKDKCSKCLVNIANYEPEQEVRFNVFCYGIILSV